MEELFTEHQEKIADFILEIASKFPVSLTIISIIGAVYACIKIIVEVTPTKKDDEFVSKWEKAPIIGKLISLLGTLKKKISLKKK